MSPLASNCVAFFASSLTTVPRYKNRSHPLHLSKLPKATQKGREQSPIHLNKRKKHFSVSTMATSISVTRGLQQSSFHGSWGSSILGEDRTMLVAKSVPMPIQATRPRRLNIVMKNVNEGKGVFAPLVVITRNVVGKKTFNQLRGKAIALHSQVINQFCSSIGADGKQRQGLIRLAKKNGERLGFLA